MNKYKMGHLEGNFTPVLYIGRKVPEVNLVCLGLPSALFSLREVFIYLFIVYLAMSAHNE